ncbi:hypothetical protein D499_0K00810 [Hanseniaspora uvarum DSM 2768]|nr:hypothetical protein D499_0K00810 [Hanseniaspora uvarum DSM 2768]
MVNMSNQKSIQNEVQTLIVPEKDQDQYIKLGLKCVTPGLPRERLDEETQKQVAEVVQQQSLQIKNRAGTDHSQTPGNTEKESFDSISEQSDPSNKNSSKQLHANISAETNGSLKRRRIPAALDLKQQPEFFTKKIKSDKNIIQTATETKPNVSIKYVGYNDVPQYVQPAPYSAGTCYNHPGYFQNDYLLMQQQYMLQQINYMNQNAAYAQQAYPQGEAMMTGYPTYITPLNNHLQYGNHLQYQNSQNQQMYQQPELPQTGLGKQQEGPRPLDDHQTHEENEDEIDEADSEFKGIISINNDSFKFEFKTRNEETVGKLQTEINDLNREKFLRICEKTWNESYWLMKKREQFSNPTPSGLAANTEVNHKEEEKENHEDSENLVDDKENGKVTNDNQEDKKDDKNQQTEPQSEVSNSDETSNPEV